MPVKTTRKTVDRVFVKQRLADDPRETQPTCPFGGNTAPLAGGSSRLAAFFVGINHGFNTNAVRAGEVGSLFVLVRRKTGLGQTGRLATQGHNDEFLKFDRIEKRWCERPDLCAFRLLNAIDPGDCDLVSAAEHDEIWLSADPVAVAAQATEAQLIDLIRCGVRYDREHECFAMFV